jgi:DNA repair protein RadC
MAITDWPKEERPREKLLRFGAQTLSDAELLAIFLRIGIKGKTAVDLARELLQQFGSLRSLLSIHSSKFCQQQGLGTTKYATLQAAIELGKRYLQETVQRSSTITSSTIKQYLTMQLRKHLHEVFACVFLDNRHRIIQYEELFNGTINCTAVYPRVVAQKALAYNAAAVVFAHNHPSGCAKPSQSDLRTTQELIAALRPFEIKVIDHIVVGEGECVSFAEEGLLHNVGPSFACMKEKFLI